MTTLRSRYLGSMFGVAVGDALGLPYEFQFPIPKIKEFCKIPGNHIQPAGTWSDDTSMSLCLAESLLNKQKNDQLDQMKLYLRWYREGYLTCHSKAIGMGNRTVEALKRFEIIRLKTFKGDITSAGNGSLMRIAPIALYYHGFPSVMLAENAKMSSQTTHDTPLCNAACELYALAINKALTGFYSKEKIFNFLQSWINRPSNSERYPKEIMDIINLKLYKNKKKLKANGYVVNSFRAALYCFHKTNNFKDGALLAVNLGYDSDTTAAIYGSLAGAFYGYDNIPRSWKDKVLKRGLIKSVAVKLYDRSKETLRK